MVPTEAHTQHRSVNPGVGISGPSDGTAKVFRPRSIPTISDLSTTAGITWPITSLVVSQQQDTHHLSCSWEIVIFKSLPSKGLCLLYLVQPIPGILVVFL